MDLEEELLNEEQKTLQVSPLNHRINSLGLNDRATSEKITLLTNLTPKRQLEIENIDVRREDEEGHRLTPMKIDFNIAFYMTSTYLIAYFFLSFMMAMIVAGSGSDNSRGCSLKIPLWYTLSLGFYILSFIICLFLMLRMRRDGLTIEVVNFGWFDMVFMRYNKKFFYALLIIIDLIQLILTIWGSVMFFGDAYATLVCQVNLPMLANFMLILLILGYIYCLRLIATVFHFMLGVTIYKYLRSHLKIFKRFDRTLTQKFPVYQYSLYIEQVNQNTNQSNLQTQQSDNERNPYFHREEEVCPICCDDFIPECEVIPMPCNDKHIFHPTCIQEWLTNNTLCPLCKTRVFTQGSSNQSQQSQQQQQEQQ